MDFQLLLTIHIMRRREPSASWSQHPRQRCSRYPYCSTRTCVLNGLSVPNAAGVLTSKTRSISIVTKPTAPIRTWIPLYGCIVHVIDLIS
eukprot:g75638.t1